MNEGVEHEWKVFYLAVDGEKRPGLKKRSSFSKSKQKFCAPILTVSSLYRADNAIRYQLGSLSEVKFCNRQTKYGIFPE